MRVVSVGLRGLLVLVVGLVVWIGRVEAGGFATLDVGVQRMAMKATVAKAEAVTTIFSNPAGLTRLKGTRFYTSLLGSYIRARFRLRKEDGTYTETIKPTRSFGGVPFIGASTDLGLERWRFGIAWYFPNLSASALPEDAPTKYHGIESYFVNYYLTPSVAYRVLPKLSLGVGASHIYAQQYFRVRIDLGELLPGLTGDGELEAWPRDSGFVWSAGVLAGPFRGVSLGLSYSSREWLEMEGRLAGRSLVPAIPLEVEGRYRMRKAIPESVRAGVIWRVNDRWSCGIDGTWWHYSIIQETVTYLTGDPLLELLSPIVSPKNYGNSWNVGLGVEYRIRGEWRWMMGLDYDDSPVPDETFSVESPTSDFWGASTGTIFPVGARWRMGVAFVAQQQRPRDVRNSITPPPSNIRSKGLNLKVGLSLAYATGR